MIIFLRSRRSSSSNFWECNCFLDHDRYNLGRRAPFQLGDGLEMERVMALWTVDCGLWRQVRCWGEKAESINDVNDVNDREDSIYEEHEL